MLSTRLPRNERGTTTGSAFTVTPCRISFPIRLSVANDGRSVVKFDTGPGARPRRTVTVRLNKPWIVSPRALTSRTLPALNWRSKTSYGMVTRLFGGDFNVTLTITMFATSKHPVTTQRIARRRGELRAVALRSRCGIPSVVHRGPGGAPAVALSSAILRLLIPNATGRCSHTRLSAGPR